MTTNKKLMAMLLIAGMMVVGMVTIIQIDESDAANTATADQFINDTQGNYSTITTEGDAKVYTLKDDLTLSTYLAIGSSKIIIDANGKTFKGCYEDSYSFYMVGSGLLEFRNGTFEGGVAIYRTGSASSYGQFILDADATLTSTGWSLIFGYQSGSYKEQYGYEAIIAGTITGPTPIFIVGYLGNDNDSCANMASSAYCPKLTIKSTAKIGNDSTSTAIAHNGFAKTTIEDGAVIKAGASDADGALLIKRGIVTVNGGTFTCGRTSAVDVSSISGNGSGTEELGCALGVTAQYNGEGYIQVVINGGTFSSTNNGGIIVCETTTKVFANGQYVKINGGTFSTTPSVQTYINGSSNMDLDLTGGTYASDDFKNDKKLSDFLENGYSVIRNSAGKYVVGATITGISLDIDELIMSVSTTATLTPTVAPAGTALSEVTWSSSNTSVATVSNGVVTAVSGGTATITATSMDTTKSATCTVTVNGDLTVTFDSNGGSDVATETVHYNSAVTEPADPTRDGYTFAGWYSDSDLTSKYDFTSKVTKSITLYAKWTTVPATYCTVTFMKDASTQYTTAKVESGKMASAPATDPTVAGSRFLGWYTTAGVTTVTSEKFDFSTKITEDITLYAGWIATCTIALPDSVENCTLSQTGKKVVSVSEGSFSFDVTPAAGYTAVVTLTQNGEDSDPIVIATTGTVTIYDLTSNVAVYVMIKAADGTYTETSKTVTENTDGTTTVIDTVVEKAVTGDATITETTSTDDEESIATTATATITDTTVALTVETSSTDVAKVTETIVYAITETAEAAGTTAVDIDVTVSTKAIELPKVILNNDKVNSVTVTVNSGSANSARISIPTDVLYSDDMADTISISVTPSTSKPASSALKGSSAIAAFDLGLTGTNTTEFNSDVSISYDVKLPTGAKNVRAYCIDSNEFINASYRNGTASFSVPHFSAWTIVYDEPVIIIEDDDDILFILEQQKKAQEAASSQTTTEDSSGEEAAIIIAAAAVAGAMLACAFFAFRRN